MCRRNRVDVILADLMRDPLGWVKLEGDQATNSRTRDQRPYVSLEGLTGWHMKESTPCVGGRWEYRFCTLRPIGLPTSPRPAERYYSLFVKWTVWRIVPFSEDL